MSGNYKIYIDNLNITEVGYLHPVLMSCFSCDLNDKFINDIKQYMIIENK